MHELYLTLVILNDIVVILAIIHVLMDNRLPAKTMAWALVIYFVPVAGIVLYVFFGVNTRRDRLVSERSMNEITRRSMLSFVGQQDLRLPENHKQTIDLFVNQSMALPFKDNTVDIYTDGYGFFPALLAAIRNATSHIHIDIYIFADDALGRLVSDSLIDKARQGVEVRVIYDDVGCWNVSRHFFERMREEGIEVCPFLPVRFPSFTSKVNYRNHRKIIVVDGKVGFIGGMNIAQRYVKGVEGRPWRDTMTKITGSAVYSLQREFLVDWYFVDRTRLSDRKYYPPVVSSDYDDCLIQIVTGGPVTPFPEIMQGYMRVIIAARRYIYIETPYFIPTEPVLFALKTAALGGIDVRIIVPERSDARFVEWAGRSYLRDMTASGVKVYLYESGFLHSKILVCDDSLATCGSTNVDSRSFENNFESNAFFYDETVARRFRRIFLEDLGRSVPLSEKPGRMNPGFFPRLWESLTRLLSPLL
ncbi:cardiolipin synthase [Prevotella sp. MGM1]|uniref:cardiolipin synthase n=1 Tax=Prevotella sp. MGM1 TaxID=2033405 RepID=UPI000CE9D264|nr:cardiolipin synthase [Prevotella sp. MGM1]GAY28366.1 cardiolipin synthase [Prevotella sp. MGM1]